MLAKRWREHGDRDAAHKLVTSHLRLVAKIAMGYGGYGLPISEVISEGNVGLMQAVKQFEPEKGFRLATYAMWWIKAAIQEYILRSWSLVKMGTTANQKEAVLQPAQGEEQDFRAGGRRSAARSGQAHRQATGRFRTGRGRHEPASGRRRWLNAPIREDGHSGEWQDWLVDDVNDQERGWRRAKNCNRRKALGDAVRCSMTASGASSRRGGSPMTRSRWRIWPPSSACHASACARSRCAPLRRCRAR